MKVTNGWLVVTIMLSSVWATIAQGQTQLPFDDPPCHKLYIFRNMVTSGMPTVVKVERKCDGKQQTQIFDGDDISFNDCLLTIELIKSSLDSEMNYYRGVRDGLEKAVIQIQLGAKNSPLFREGLVYPVTLDELQHWLDQSQDRLDAAIEQTELLRSFVEEATTYAELGRAPEVYKKIISPTLRQPKMLIDLQLGAAMSSLSIKRAFGSMLQASFSGQMRQRLFWTISATTYQTFGSWGQFTGGEIGLGGTWFVMQDPELLLALRVTADGGRAVFNEKPTPMIGGTLAGLITVPTKGRVDWHIILELGMRAIDELTDQRGDTIVRSDKLSLTTLSIGASLDLFK